VSRNNEGYTASDYAYSCVVVPHPKVSSLTITVNAGSVLKKLFKTQLAPSLKIRRSNEEMCLPRLRHGGMNYA
jgi:hypothetical protein